MAPCFLPNLLAGPYWVLAIGTSGGKYSWAVVVGGQPTEHYDDGCTTKTSGINDSGLWLFSREPVASATDLASMYAVLKTEGISRSQLHKVAQSDCTYHGGFIKK